MIFVKILLTMTLIVKKVKFKTCYLIILQDNGPGNVNYDRFVKKLRFQFFLKMIVNTALMMTVMIAVMMMMMMIMAMRIAVMMMTAVMIVRMTVMTATWIHQTVTLPMTVFYIYQGMMTMFISVMYQSNVMNKVNFFKCYFIILHKNGLCNVNFHSFVKM